MRTTFLASFFGVPVDEMKMRYTKVKHRLDKQAEQDNVQGDVIDAYYALFLEMGYKESRDDAKYLNDIISQLFLMFPPDISLDLLKKIREYMRNGRTFSITSNTNFVSGKIIRRHLINMRVPFNFALFSDEVRHAKPSKDIFDMVKNDSSKMSHEIAHIGDNKFADWEGAKAQGFASYLVESPDDVPDVIDMISML